MKKPYEAPVLNSEPVALGVFGMYNVAQPKPGYGRTPIKFVWPFFGGWGRRR